MYLKKYSWWVFLAVIFTLGLSACGEPTSTPQPVAVSPQAPVFTRTAPPTGASTQVAIALTPPPGTRTTRPTNRPTNNPPTPTVAATRRANPTAAVAGDPKLVEEQSERTVIRTFTDKKGRTAKLIYGRGNGRGGDYGWAHIYGKHVLGIWYDGGTITTFPKALGTKTPDEVAELVGKSITQDNNPDEQGNNRRSYVYAVSGTNFDVFTVVGGDGTIITSYPVRHGTKDEDN